jgi:hypothetical protein
MVRRHTPPIEADVARTLEGVADALRRLGRGPDALRRADRLLARAARELALFRDPGDPPAAEAGGSRPGA